MQEKAGLERLVHGFEAQEQVLEDAATLLELGEEAEDAESLAEVETLLDGLESGLASMEVQRLLGQEGDENGAILELNSGAGGTEAQDWVAMLMRMYLRWAETQGFKADVVDALPGTEAGYTKVVIQVTGDYAYGFLKSEVGVHRLVRISPFDAAARRQTSFASAAVYPDVDDSIVVDIADGDIRIDVFRSSGAGGQSVNTTDSAVRITHLPTGLVVSCQNERSQHKNKATAMKILRARIYELELRKQQEALEASQDKRKIDFGSQIRSYVMQPYQMVKDHRTNHETGGVDAVLDGAVTPFMEAWLAQLASGDGAEA